MYTFYMYSRRHLLVSGHQAVRKCFSRRLQRRSEAAVLKKSPPRVSWKPCYRPPVQPLQWF